MSDIKRLGNSGSADYATAVKRYGGGGDNNRPELGRWCHIQVTGIGVGDIPLFEKTEAEMQAMYSNLNSISGVTLTTGQYAQYRENFSNTYLYNNTAVMETPSSSACWSPSTPSQLYTAPPTCPTGFSTSGILYDKDSATSDEPGKTGIHHSTSDLGWMSYQYLGYICPSGFVSNVNVRICYKSGTNNAITDGGTTTSGV
tara:strand:+ start:288 stop:887 length:600 start_codon:yes stop_codon:yes gene_type:complete